MALRYRTDKLSTPLYIVLGFVVVGLLLSLLLLGFIQTKTTMAVDASDWKAGRIIDDSVFYDSSSMTVSQIQTFLNNQLPSSCDTFGKKLSEYGGPDLNGDGKVQRWEWGKHYHNQTTFICLKDYYQVPRSDKIIDNFNKTASRPDGSISAAKIIKDAGKAYDVSPKVLLVLLRKESAGPLPFDTWPLKRQYRSAMGYACPDTAPCDPQYAGFYNQMMNAAKRLKSYKDNPESYRHQPFAWNNTVYYHPDLSRCGHSAVYIETRATAGLYNYTPYQPNSASLKAYPGTGDSCSSYGNRNFWFMYNSWFGSTHGSPFVAYDGTVYIEGAADTYYRVPNPETLRTYGYGTIFKTVRKVNSDYFKDKTNMGVLPLIARFEGTQIFAVSSGGLAHFSRSVYEDNYGYTIGEEAKLSEEWLARFRQLSPVEQVLKLSDGSPIYYVENGKKRHISSPTAYSTMGSPVYSAQSSATLNSLYASSIPSGSPILVSNVAVLAANTNKLYFWDGTRLLPVGDAASGAVRDNIKYSASSQQLLQLPLSSYSVSKYAKTSSNTYYLLDSHRKFPLSSDDLSKLGLSENALPVIPDALAVMYTSTSYENIPLLRFGSESRVYRQTSKKQLYAVHDPYDFTKFGLSFSNVASLPIEIKKITTDNGVQFSQLRLVQVAGENPVYISDNGSNQLYHILSRDIAQQYRIKLSDIAIIGSLSSEAPSYTKNTLERIMKDERDAALWLIDRGIKYKIPSNTVATFNYSSDGYEALSPSFIDRYKSKGELTKYLRDYSKGAVYRIENGKKRWYSSRKAFENDPNASWSSVRDVSPGYLSTIPSGSKI